MKTQYEHDHQKFSWLRCDVDGQDKALVDEIWNKCLNVAASMGCDSIEPKCYFMLQRSLVQEGLHAASDKIEAIVNAPSPKDVKKLHFLPWSCKLIPLSRRMMCTSEHPQCSRTEIIWKIWPLLNIH